MKATVEAPAAAEGMPLYPEALPGEVNGSAPREGQAARTEVELMLARFRLRARRRGAWLQYLWGTEGASGGRGVVSDAEMAMILADRDSPENEAAWYGQDAQLRPWNAELADVETALATLPKSRLSRLAEVFGLSPADLDLLQACACVALDPALARACAYLQDHVERAAVTEELAARLYGHGRCGVWPAESPLFRWELIDPRAAAPGESRLLACDPQVRDWLIGKAALSEALVGVARLRVPELRLASWPVEECAKWLGQTIFGQQTARVRVVVDGWRGSGRRSFAAAVADKLAMPLLEINADQVEDGAWRRVFMHAQRQAYLDGCALAWVGESLGRRAWPQAVPEFPLQFAVGEPGVEWPPVPHLVTRHFSLPTPSIEERAALWRDRVPAARSWTQDELRHLAERHRVNPGDIAHAARLGARLPEEAARLARESARGRLGSLAQVLETPFKWDDLVLTPAVRQALEAIAHEADHRARFWERPEARRLFPQGRGLLALFSGPPGTGKTMAAQVIAAHLGQDLFRVNVAQLVSKWVGETAKHFDFLLTQAAEMDAVVFFDEADAPFAKRSSEVRDAQDKFANTDAAFLLQAVENFPGVALLATNLKGNIDQAFFRRLRHVVEFPKPDASLQLILWEKLLNELVGGDRCRALRPVLAALSTGLEATGAQIKYAILGAIFAAQREGAPVDARHLLFGLERELAKEGRSIGPRDRERILRNG